MAHGALCGTRCARRAEPGDAHRELRQANGNLDENDAMFIEAAARMECRLKGGRYIEFVAVRARDKPSVKYSCT